MVWLKNATEVTGICSFGDVIFCFPFSFKAKNPFFVSLGIHLVNTTQTSLFSLSTTFFSFGNVPKGLPDANIISACWPNLHLSTAESPQVTFHLILSHELLMCALGSVGMHLLIVFPVKFPQVFYAGGFMYFELCLFCCFASRPCSSLWRSLHRFRGNCAVSKLST